MALETHLPPNIEDATPEKPTSGEEKADASAMGPVRRRAVMFSLCLALFLSALDITIISTALPTIARSLNSNAADYAWIGTSYTLATTSSVPIWAKLSDIFGRKPIIILSNGFFLAGSLASGLAYNVSMLIGGRIVQGLGAGGCHVMVNIIIGDLFSLRDRAKYFGMTGLVYAISSAVGPILGGVFTQTIGWRWCFFINLPFDGVSLIVLFFALNIHTPKIPIIDGLRQLDWIGSVLVVGGTICFLYGLELGAGGSHSWESAMVLCLLIFGVVILGLFGFHEYRFAKNPLMPLRIFYSVSNIASIVVMCLHSFVFIAHDYFIPLYFQAALGFSPIISGVTFFALVIPLTVLTTSTGWFVQRTGNYRLPIWSGGIIMTLGTGLFINLDSTTNWPKIIIFQIIAGMGVGPLFQSPMIALHTHVREEDVAASSSASMFLRNLLSSMSIVIGSVLLQKTLGGGSLTMESSSKNVHSAAASGQYVSALKLMWIFYCAVCGVMFGTSLFIKGPRKDTENNTEVITNGQSQSGLNERNSGSL